MNKIEQKKPTCVFGIENTGPGDLVLALEPCGCEFLLPLNEQVQVRLFGSDSPVLFNVATSKDGKRYMAFWPAKGEYELFFKGRRVWDIIDEEALALRRSKVAKSTSASATADRNDQKPPRQ